MRIGVDARPITEENIQKAKDLLYSGNYLYNILKYITDENMQDEFVLYSNKPFNYHSDVVGKYDCRVIEGKTGTLAVCEGLAAVLEEDKVDTFWGTQHMLPLDTKGIRRVLTVHDLSLIINPLWGSSKNAIMQNMFATRSIKQADVIMADSISTKADIIRLMKMAENKISVIYPGNPIQPGKTDEPGDVRKCNDDKYFLYVGTVEPRKNLINLIKAFEYFCDNVSDEYSLILAGGLGWKYKGILRAAAASRYAAKIDMRGFVSEEEKRTLYTNACALVLVSNYEGYGYPVVEAYSYGIPAIVSRVSSLPEVAGGCGFYVADPHDYKKTAAQMEKVSKLTALERKELSEDCRKYIEKFDMKKSVEDTLKIIRGTEE